MSAARPHGSNPELDGALRFTRRPRARGFRGPTARALLLGLAVGLVAAALGPVGTAAAASLTIAGPGSVTNDSTPSFSGATEDELELDPVTLTITNVNGESPPQEPHVSRSGGSWKATAEPLPDGSYTAQATQLLETATVEFTVDTTAPHVTMALPVDHSSTATEEQRVSGTAGTEKGVSRDVPTVTVRLFSGSSTSAQNLAEAIILPVSNGAWSGTFGGLGAGTYTVRAEQSDLAGNVGRSAPATFAVTTLAALGGVPPLASFRWFPAAPKTGENVSLVSSSTDAISPITAFAWALSASGPFQAGKPVMTTSFSTPGIHVVRLRVTDGNGLSSVAAQAIPVTSAPLTLMQPFPIVRIAGSETSFGVHLSLLSAQAPAGARVTVTCRGRGCPARSESRVVLSSRRQASTFLVQFRRFERGLRDGIVLEIRISKAGEIGKYTRFAIRRHRLPAREDSCLGPSGGKPLVCPSS
jgi:hypothetical protein